MYRESQIHFSSAEKRMLPSLSEKVFEKVAMGK